MFLMNKKIRIDGKRIHSETDFVRAVCKLLNREDVLLSLLSELKTLQTVYPKKMKVL